MALGNRLEGKTCIVTGSASGIGRAIAYRFAMEGAFVSVIDIDPTGSKETVETIIAQGGSAIAIESDLSNSQQTQNAIEMSMEKLGYVEILVNNAAIEFVGTIEQTSIEDWERLLAINLKSVFLCSKLIIPYMKKREKGAIVNIASVNGLLGIPKHAAYNASKGGVISLTRQLAVDYGPFGIRVNCICPCTTDTPMVRKPLDEKNADEYLKQQGKYYPLKRIGKPEDIANAALFLASEEASWITDVILPVDGGSSCGKYIE